MSLTHLLGQGWLTLLLLAWITLSIGSFLNVAIYRLPVMMKRDWRAQATEVLELSTPAGTQPHADESPFNLAVPRSRCPKGATAISAWHNIPVLSWLWLRGRCAHCNAPISARYPFVELLTCVASLMVVATLGYTWIGLAGPRFHVGTSSHWHSSISIPKLPPDQITLPLLWLGLIVNLASGGFIDLSSAVVGAIAGLSGAVVRSTGRSS